MKTKNMCARWVLGAGLATVLCVIAMVSGKSAAGAGNSYWEAHGSHHCERATSSARCMEWVDDGSRWGVFCCEDQIVDPSHYFPECYRMQEPLSLRLHNPDSDPDPPGNTLPDPGPLL